MTKSTKPNILVLWGDDIGWWNINYNNRGQMGYTHAQHRPSGQRRRSFHRLLRPAELHRWTCRLYNRPEPAPYRSDQGRDAWTDIGRQPEDPTIAELLKPHGYATGQFGKNHFGDKDEYLPTNHGFDEFFGNLYAPQCRRRTRGSGLPERPGVQEAVWPAWGDPQLCGRTHRGHRAADEEADGNHRRRSGESLFLR